ncbi:MAG: 2-isopropylmalate synthase [Nitrospinae bacterium]|nr:2-isopropylmalate synthase [Nitrospinota bacterium]
MNDIIIFDTTLRDGEQSPGFSMTTNEKIQMAQQLEKLKVDVIEAGFPIASDGDFEAVKQISQEIKNTVICGLSRVMKKDIDRAWEALQYAKKARIHTFIATSDIHIKHKFNKTREEIFQMAIEGVKHAKSYTDDVEFSAEDAFRSDRGFLAKIVEETIRAGATTVNIPDTVGYAITSEFGDLIKFLFDTVPNINDAIISVHCHNDLGLGVSNSLAAVENGARQIECTINGIGERAGNASLEEVVMSINTRKNFFNVRTNINTKEIYPSSQKLVSITGVPVQPNKAIVGDNAFAHEAGIHQDGFLKNKSTYEIMTPQSIGKEKSNLVMGKHSGRHAFQERLTELGYSLDEKELDDAFKRLKELADKKKTIYEQDLIAIVEEQKQGFEEKFKLQYVQSSSGNRTIPTATVEIIHGKETIIDAAIGDGPVDAAYKAISRITGCRGELKSYNIRSISEGRDALGEVTVKVAFDDVIVKGKALSTDVIEASAKAYLNAVNRFLSNHSVDDPKVEKI